MPDDLAGVLATPGVEWVFAVSLLAGLVYGFAGFGSALIFMPVATLVVAPAVAIAAFAVSALASALTVVPGAWRVADRRAAAWMVAGCVVATPLGVGLLRAVPTDGIRAAVSVIVLATLVALARGWRLRVAPGRAAQGAIGAAAGVIGGATGLNGPVVILFNLGTGQPAEVTRANTAVFLTTTSLSFVPQLWLQGLVGAEALWLGALLLAPYAGGTWLGVRLFQPGCDATYRCAAFALIAAAGLAGLPIWE